MRDRPTLLGLDRTAFKRIGGVMLLTGLVIAVYDISYRMTSIPMPQPHGQLPARCRCWRRVVPSLERTQRRRVRVYRDRTHATRLRRRVDQRGHRTPDVSVLAGESSDAVEIASEAVARGLAKGGIQAGTAQPAAPSAGMKVKCRDCGYLDSDDATYCSKGGEPL